MNHFSVIIPQCDRADDVRRQLPGLGETLDRLGQPYEIIVVDDASAAPNVRLLDKLLGECHALRLVRIDEPSGTSLSIAAGIRAARGDILLAIEAGEAYPPQEIPRLLSWLDRADFIAGRRRRQGSSKVVERIARIPRWLLLGLESHDPGCLFWAARREALADILLTAGMARYLPALVAHQGFRVCEAYVEHSVQKGRRPELRPNPGDLLAAWWQCRRWRRVDAREVTAGGDARPSLRLLDSDGTSAAASTSHASSPMPQAKRA